LIYNSQIYYNYKFKKRCGSIQVGDQIHLIDDIPLDTCTLDEAMRLLQRSARIVKLVIIKGGGQEQVNKNLERNFLKFPFNLAFIRIAPIFCIYC